MIHLDFETYSELSVKEVGAYRYASDPSTEVLILAWSVNSEDIVNVWCPCDGTPPPERLMRLVKDGELMVAHNAQFERAIWEAIMVRRHKAPRTRPEQWHCTAARAASAGLPRALDKATAMIGTPHKKNPAGKTLIKMFCGPRKATKKDKRTRIHPKEAREAFRDFVRYCVDDVRAERALDEALPPLTKPEVRLFALDMIINERGIPLDSALVHKAIGVVKVLEESIHASVRALTGLAPTQVAKLKDWLNDHDVPLGDMQAESIRRILPSVADETAAMVLRMRMEAGKVSTKKLAAMKRCMIKERVLGTILFYGAHTGRWSGKLVQPHNFIRGNLELPQQTQVLDMLDRADPEIMAMIWEWPLDAIAQVMRSFIKASKGTRLLVADYAAIEARVLAWLADELGMLEAYRRGVDVYKLMASKLFKVPIEQVTSEQRRIAKNLVLGCGYGLGYVNFVGYCDKAGVTITEDFSREAVGAYRDECPNIVKYWRTVQRAFVHAATKHTEVSLPHGLRFGWDRGWVYITLPSGRRLHYWDVRVSYEKNPKRAMPDTVISYADTPHSRSNMYGGKIVENIVQAVARDIMANGMWNAERAGYPVVSTVHDEVLAELDVGKGELSEYVAALCRLPAWARGCPITAEGFETQRYRKD